MRVLCVAEKPSAAKKIASVLSQNNFRTSPTGDMHVKNYEFTYNLNNRPTTFVMTALKGHLLELEFEGQINRNWAGFPLEDLFYVPVVKKVSEKMKPISDNIEQQIRRADVLFIWTDCDREGEAIGGDVMDLCRKVKSNLTTWRARFSSMQSNAINYAAQHHEEIDMKQVEAVRARSELDLRIGAAFTRLQSMQLKQYFSMEDNKVLSYGSCQFPTLGFVVERSRQVDNFIPEDFWKITMSHTQQNEQQQQQLITTKFNWRRTHLFDRWACFIFYEICYEKKVATVTKVKSKQTSKWKPLPLTTVEMQKVACRVLNLSGSEIMSIAEELYTAGLISYPRTETDQFDQGFDFNSLIQIQTQDPSWGEYARIIKDGEFETPRNGRNNDKAHPPIHPTSYDANLSGNKKRVYEFIARRFLGCCWKNAIGHETTVEVKMDTEYFDAKGLVILERNYLEVYTYDKWNGNEIPEFHEGEEFIPATLEMEQGQTTAPKYLTESDLISLMEKHEIGTDATIAEHIQKILDRKYVFKESQYFKPLTLGTSLILGYDQVGLDAKLSKPDLRRQMEADLKSICLGTISPDVVRNTSLRKYLEMFSRLKTEFSKVKQSMDTHFREGEDRSNAPATSYRRGGNDDFGGGANGRGGRGGRGGGGGSGRGSGNNRGNRGGRGSRGGRGGGSGGGSYTSRPDNNTSPNCNHNKPAVIRKVNKEGNNKGREFFTCGDPDSCGFFEWVDGYVAPSSSSNHTTPRSFNNNSSNNNNNNSNNNYSNYSNDDDSEYPYCGCSKRAVKRTVTSAESANRGKAFFCCVEGRDNGCSFFDWVP